MGNIIVGGGILLLVLWILRSLYKEKKKYGACAYCSYAHSGKCNHVGHRELDGQESPGGMTELERLRSGLTEEQRAILDRHTGKHRPKG